MERVRIHGNALRWIFDELWLAPVEQPPVVRTCPACWRDFRGALDQDPETVFFCADCSRPPAPGDDLGGSD